MSTILDALKKSEQERKLNKVPTLNDMTAPQEQSQWPQRIIIILLLLVLLLIFMFVKGSILDNQLLDGSTSLQSNNIVLDNESLSANTSELSTTTASNEIIVNVVSYAVAPETRFVMINGKMYREGDFIRAGLKVERIKPDSVIINQRGRRLEKKP